MKKVLKNEFDLSLTFNASKFNEENGIVKSMHFWGIPVIENVEKYAGLTTDNKKVYYIVDIIDVRAMQGKTRSSIEVKYQYMLENNYTTISSWCNIKDLSKESSERVLNAIREYLNR